MDKWDKHQPTINEFWLNDNIEKNDIWWQELVNSNSYSFGWNSWFSSFNSWISKNQAGQSIDFTRQILSNDNNSSQTSFSQTNDLHYTKVWKIVGQMLDSYIIVENDPNIYIFDQHALAERILYEKLLTKDSSLSQKLLIPENITLQISEFETYLSYKNEILDMWFDIEELSKTTISIYSIPEFIKNQDIKNIFLWILDDINSWNIDKSISLNEIKNIIFSYAACRAAIKFWDKLSLFEMNHLLNEWAEIYSSTCPHWRPSVYKMSKNELNLKFLR